MDEHIDVPEDLALAMLFFSVYLTFIIAHVAKREWPSGAPQRKEKPSGVPR